MNRESWLTDLAQQIVPWFKGYELGKFVLTCGWPCRGAVSAKGQRVGECHYPKSSKAGVHEIFISPVLDKPLEVAGTVVHEMAHVAAGPDAKHGKKFVSVAHYVGLTKGKPTSIMPGVALDEKLQRIIDAQGEYPHKAIVPVAKIVKASSMVKLVCECGFSATASTKRLEEAGLPTCGCGSAMSVQRKEE